MVYIISISVYNFCSLLILSWYRLLVPVHRVKMLPLALYWKYFNMIWGSIAFAFWETFTGARFSPRLFHKQLDGFIKGFYCFCHRLVPHCEYQTHSKIIIRFCYSLALLTDAKLFVVVSLMLFWLHFCHIFGPETWMSGFFIYPKNEKFE